MAKRPGTSAWGILDQVADRQRITVAETATEAAAEVTPLTERATSQNDGYIDPAANRKVDAHSWVELAEADHLPRGDPMALPNRVALEGVHARDRGSGKSNRRILMEEQAGTHSGEFHKRSVAPVPDQPIGNRG
jgi:hypothetical protein